MALIYDELGNVIGDDGSAANEWDTNTPSPGMENWNNFATQGFSQPPQSVGPSDVGYFQQKINDFQATLYSVDATAQALQGYLDEGSLSGADAADISDLLSQYSMRKAAFKYSAEAFNLVSGAVNAVGASLPVLTIPSGLGFAPLAVPLAEAAAIAGAAALISWAITWLSTSRQKLSALAQHYADMAAATSDPSEQTRLLNLAAQAQADQQKTDAQTSTLGQLAGVVKWIAIGAGVFLIIDLLKNQPKKKRIK